jgi:hypothetical protein
MQRSSRQSSQDKTSLPISPIVTVFTLMPVFLLDAVYYMWVFTALFRMISLLGQSGQSAKLSLCALRPPPHAVPALAVCLRWRQRRHPGKNLRWRVRSSITACRACVQVPQAGVCVDRRVLLFAQHDHPRIVRPPPPPPPLSMQRTCSPPAPPLQCGVGLLRRRLVEDLVGLGLLLDGMYIPSHTHTYHRTRWRMHARHAG